MRASPSYGPPTAQPHWRQFTGGSGTQLTGQGKHACSEISMDDNVSADSVGKSYNGGQAHTRSREPANPLPRPDRLALID